MAYRRNYRRRPTKSFSQSERAAIEHVHAYRQLTQKLGPVVPEIRDAFLNLNASSLEELFNQYRKQYGAKAAAYAAETLPKWRSGETKMSGQTAERIINLVPPYLSTSKRYELVKTLCQHHRKKDYRTVRVDPKDLLTTESSIRSEIRRFAELASQENLPDRVFESINWLNNNDTVIARKMVNEIQKKQTEDINRAVAEQTPKILSLISQKQVDGYSERFDFPNGQLLIIFQKQQPCFVATAVFGDPSHPHVRALRAYRDRQLSQSSYGRSLIRYYWIYGPLAAAWISGRPGAQTCLRAIISALTPRIFGKFYD